MRPPSSIRSTTWSYCALVPPGNRGSRRRPFGAPLRSTFSARGAIRSGRRAGSVEPRDAALDPVEHLPARVAVVLDLLVEHVEVLGRLALAGERHLDAVHQVAARVAVGPDLVEQDLHVALLC